MTNFVRCKNCLTVFADWQEGCTICGVPPPKAEAVAMEPPPSPAPNLATPAQTNLERQQAVHARWLRLYLRSHPESTAGLAHAELIKRICRRTRRAEYARTMQRLRPPARRSA